MAMLDVALGGRAAEEVIFGPGKVTPISQNDLMVRIKTFSFGYGLICQSCRSCSFSRKQLESSHQL